MASYKESDCVGCPQGCIHCGREMPYTMYECDWCGKTTVEQDDIEYLGKYEICKECYEKWENEELDDDGNEIEVDDDV